MVWEKIQMQSHEKCSTEILSEESLRTHQNAQATAHFQASYPSEMLVLKKRYI